MKTHKLQGRSRARVRAFVRGSVELIARQLVTRLAVDQAVAEDVARDAVHDICSAHGGSFLYVPKDLEFELSKRDLEIFERFNGQNLHELVEQYGVTHTRIYQIVARVKAEQIARRQGRLPGFDEDGAAEPA